MNLYKNLNKQINRKEKNKSKKYNLALKKYLKRGKFYKKYSYIHKATLDQINRNLKNL
jgi:hypothetical protein